jgi:hypothetical protein
MTKTKLTLAKQSKPKLYCGKAEELPDGYDDYGTSFECLRKGFGAGYATASNKEQKILSLNDIQSIAKVLSIPLNTKRGKKSAKTLIKNIINALNDL